MGPGRSSRIWCLSWALVGLIGVAAADYELVFEGTTCNGKDDCTPLRFSTGKDFAKATFTVDGDDAKLEACSAKCDEDEACLGIYIFPFKQTSKCRGLRDLGTDDG